MVQKERRPGQLMIVLQRKVTIERGTVFPGILPNAFKTQ
jgi:hypothetical protein